jgi:hypothetical protein
MGALLFHKDKPGWYKTAHGEQEAKSGTLTKIHKRDHDMIPKYSPDGPGISESSAGDH